MSNLKDLKFDHIAINVEDISLSAEWYKNTLAAVVDYIDDTWAMLDVSGTKIALTTKSQHPPHFAFCVNDISDLGEDYREHRDGSCYVYRSDPDGNTIELIHWRSDVE